MTYIYVIKIIVMKKKLLALSGFLLAAFTGNAQSSLTADLELIFRDTTRNFIINPGDSANIGFAVVNHGPEDIDTSGYVLFSMTTIPPNYFLIVQNDDGQQEPIPDEDTVLSRGILFINNEFLEEDVVTDYCYFLRVNEDPDSFVYDPNQQNDTICFSVTYKGTGATSIAAKSAAPAEVTIYPNPAAGRVSLGIGTPERQTARIRVYGIDGRTVHEAEAIISKNDPVWLDIRGWTKGLYFVAVRTGQATYTGRLAVE